MTILNPKFTKSNAQFVTNFIFARQVDRYSQGIRNTYKHYKVIEKPYLVQINYNYKMKEENLNLRKLKYINRKPIHLISETSDK